VDVVFELPAAGGAPRERSDAARNRLRILEAAGRVLDAHGAAGLTMDAVAAEAGVGKGTLFRRFGDREGLAEALLDGPMREFQQRVLTGPPPLGPDAAAEERLEAFCDELVRLIAAHLPVVLLASDAPSHRRSSAFGFLLLHVRVLLRDAAPHLDDAVVARLLLGALWAPVVADALDQGSSVDAVAHSARTLARGLLLRPQLSRRAPDPRR
jgi:AcrR family transcriptional regulator